MGQSNFNKSAIKAKTNGANEKSKVEPVYRNILIVLGALLVAFMIFGVLVSCKVINCTNSSTKISTGPNGEEYYVAAVTNKEGTAYETIYYFIDADGKRVDCFYSEELNDVCVYDDEDNAVAVMVDGGEVGDSVDGKTLLSEYSPFTGRFYYYFLDENGQKVNCTLSQDYSQIFYTDAEGQQQEFVFAPVSGSDVSGTDVTATDAQ